MISDILPFILGYLNNQCLLSALNIETRLYPVAWRSWCLCCHSKLPSLYMYFVKADFIWLQDNNCSLMAWLYLWFVLRGSTTPWYTFACSGGTSTISIWDLWAHSVLLLYEKKPTSMAKFDASYRSSPWVSNIWNKNGSSLAVLISGGTLKNSTVVIVLVSVFQRWVIPTLESESNLESAPFFD